MINIKCVIDENSLFIWENEKKYMISFEIGLYLSIDS